ncbi:hypothetical protein, partial [Ideonella azotifigens]
MPAPTVPQPRASNHSHTTFRQRARALLEDLARRPPLDQVARRTDAAQAQAWAVDAGDLVLEA